MKPASLPIDLLAPWAEFNGVTYNGVKVQRISIDGKDRGSGVLAIKDLDAAEEAPMPVLMVIPQSLVLSLGFVENHAKSDKHLRQVLEAAGEFGRTARGAILIFLLIQLTSTSPDVPEKTGVSNALTEYVQFLPGHVHLPTFFSEAETGLLQGTSLAGALQAKSRTLIKEFDLLRQVTESIPWCQKIWWDEEEGLLSIDDWKLVDSWYRSRALDLPGTGHAMVPCVDMANHASGEDAVALYETNADGDAILQLRSHVSQGEEVTITYGDEKGACEMLFSYGFIEGTMTGARELFLDLNIPDDDPLKPAKLRVSRSAPGFKLSDYTGTIEWEGDFIWWGCVNEEDGLDFQLLQKTDGERELSVKWRDTEIPDTANLKELLEHDELWDVFQLRAMVLLQARIDEQMVRLNESRADAARARQTVEHDTWTNIMRLRQLEWQLLAKGYQEFERQKENLLETTVVQNYFQSRNVEDNTEDNHDDSDEDFA